MTPRYLLFVIAAAWCGCVAAVPEFGYQIHSYNDLREWPSLYRKGAEWLKIDMNYQTPAWCTSTSIATERVRNGQNGCFVLSHDIPTLIRSQPYNTSDDVLVAAAAADRPLYIALCFKYAIPHSNVCSDETNATLWRALIDRFYVAAQSLNATVHFVLDGSGTPDDSAPCLKERWRPWPATYIPYSNAPAAFTSDNRTLAYDRFAVLNIEYETFFLVSARHYGKFNEEPYPFLLWEPSDQTTQLAIANAYVDNGYTHSSAFRFAINIDPIQLEVYLAEVSKRAWNLRTNLTSAVNPRSAHAYLQSDNTNILAVAHFDESTKATAFVLYQFDHVLGNLTIQQHPTALPSALNLSPRHVITAFNTFTVDSELYLFVANDAVEYAVVRVNSSTEWSTLSHVMSSGVFQLTCDSTLQYATALRAVNNATVLFITATCVNEESELVAQIFTLDCHQWKLAQNRQVYALLTANPIDNWSIATVSLSSADHSVCSPDDLTIVLVHSFNLVVSLSSFCYQITSDTYQPVTHISEVAVGSNPSLSVQRDPISSRSYAFLVVSNGYCFNNEIDNKRPAPALCNSEPMPLSGVLTYTIAPISEWTTKKSLDMFHSCNQTILHGMFDQGTQPNALLIHADDASGRRSIGLIEVHRGIATAMHATEATDSPGDATLCGLAQPHDGLVIDSFEFHFPTVRLDNDALVSSE